MQDKLEKVYKSRSMMKIRNTYNTDSVAFDQDDTTFQPKIHQEYEYNGKRYVRIEANSCYDRKNFTLSNGEKYKDGDNVNETMYFDNLEDIKKYANEIICFYSKNDPYLKYEVEKEFADTIATKQIVIDDGGHLNAESGYSEFKELLRYI